MRRGLARLLSKDDTHIYEAFHKKILFLSPWCLHTQVTWAYSNTAATHKPRKRPSGWVLPCLKFALVFLASRTFCAEWSGEQTEVGQSRGRRRVRGLCAIAKEAGRVPLSWMVELNTREMGLLVVKKRSRCFQMKPGKESGIKKEKEVFPQPLVPLTTLVFLVKCTNF